MDGAEVKVETESRASKVHKSNALLHLVSQSTTTKYYHSKKTETIEAYSTN